MVKDMDIPMLAIVNRIHPAFAFVYALTIFALIFNTAFSLYYAIARRFSGGSTKRMRGIIILVVCLGYVCSFGGFKALVNNMYPILGYMGLLLLAVLLVAWIRERSNIITEMLLRRKMIRLMFKKYDEDVDYTKRDQSTFRKLGEVSVEDTDGLKADIKSYAKEGAEQHEDLRAFAEKNIPVNDQRLREGVESLLESSKEAEK